MRERPVSVLILGILNIGFGLLELVMVFLSKALEGFISGASGPSINPTLSKAQVVWNYISTGFPLRRLASSLRHPGLWAPSPLCSPQASVCSCCKTGPRLVSFGYAIYTIISALEGTSGSSALSTVRLLHDAHQDVSATNLVLIIGAAAIGAIATFIYPVILLYFLKRPKVVAVFKQVSS